MGNQWEHGTAQVWKTMFQNVSCWGFDLPQQICSESNKHGFLGCRERQLGRALLAQGALSSASGSPSSLSTQSQPIQPCWLFSRQSPANCAEWQGDFAHMHRLDHLLEQTKTKTAELHADCPSQWSCEASPSWWPSARRAAPQHT